MPINYHPDDRSGIYLITCLANNKYYIGQAYHMWYRCYVHCSKLKSGSHPNKHLQAAYNIYGAKKFMYEVLYTCPIADLNEKEINAVAQYGRENLFNFTIGGEGLKGFKHSESSKQKVRDTKNTKWLSGTYTTPEMAVKRINVFTGQEHMYDRPGNAEKDGFSKKAITSCLCGVKKTHKGFFWCKLDSATTYEEFKNSLSHLSLQQAKSYYSFAMRLDGQPTEVLENTMEFISRRRGGSKSKRIERIDMITGIIKEYDSVASAARDGFDRSTIQRALSGKIKTYRGFYWQFL